MFTVERVCGGRGADTELYKTGSAKAALAAQGKNLTSKPLRVVGEDGKDKLSGLLSCHIRLSFPQRSTFLLSLPFIRRSFLYIPPPPPSSHPLHPLIPVSLLLSLPVTWVLAVSMNEACVCVCRYVCVCLSVCECVCLL